MKYGPGLFTDDSVKEITFDALTLQNDKVEFKMHCVINNLYNGPRENNFFVPISAFEEFLE